MARRAICISHATGAGGDEVGRAVADRLGLRYVDDEIIAEAAEWADLDPELVADAERRKPLVARMLELLGEQSPAAHMATASTGRTLPTGADLRGLIVDVLRSSAEKGDVVIVAHAASFALAGRDVLRVLVTASPEVRAGRIAETRGVSERDASRMVRDEDSGRADYLRRFYDVDRELPTHFDVVVNTDVLGVDTAVDVVLAAV